MSDLDSTVPDGFRVIPGFPRYAINESGIILSACPRNGIGKPMPWTDAKRLVWKKDKDGYYQVGLCHDGQVRQIKVHKLVLLTFIGPCPQGMQCRHIDGNQTNNHVSNLAWGSSLENQRDRILHGTSNIGDRNANAKLKDSDVLEIRARAANGETLTAIAKDFAVYKGTISKIVLRHNWKHV